MTGWEWSVVGGCAALASCAAFVWLRQKARYMPDRVVEKLIADNAAKGRTRQRWTDYDPAVRERAVSKQKQHDRAKSVANRIASTSVDSSEVVDFDKRRRG